MTEHPLLRQAALIAGAGHSGSTLLGLALGSHPEVFYTGEAIKTRLFADPTQPLRKRACKLCGVECPVWRRFRPDSKYDLYEQVARLTRRSTVVDSSKQPSWIGTRIQALSARGIPVLLIWLRRDGRAVLRSRLRKYPRATPTDLVVAWKERMQQTRQLMRDHSGPQVVVHYETLARQPQRVLTDLCRRLGLEYAAQMLEYERAPHHPLGGNNGTQSLVARAQGVNSPLLELSERRKDYYAQHQGGFQPDDRWQHELDAPTLSLFERLAGSLNAELAP